MTTPEDLLEEGKDEHISKVAMLEHLLESSVSSWDVEFRDKTRFWVQHVFVPFVVGVGVLGNIVTIFILTRRQMRTSSNIYLTALAVSDLMFLIFSFSMSWKHYKCMKGIWLYWQYIPFGLWFTDASSSTSVWLTVSFTIERFIAVCHPLIGKVYCTEKRAKYVSLLVYMLCFLLTSSTPFEWKTVAKLTTDINRSRSLGSGTNKTMYILQSTDLGNNQMYRLLYHWFTIIFFVVLPLFILAILNVCLINTVRNSRTIRNNMTNSQRQHQRRFKIMRQENQITVTLIAVVIMFLICQMPTAVVLIYTSIRTPATHESAEENVLLGLGNIFNLLVAVNAACNFLLYTALSDNYRRVFVDVLFCRYGEANMRERKRRIRVVYTSHTRFSSGSTGSSACV